jgi:hypothetical protein
VDGGRRVFVSLVADGMVVRDGGVFGRREVEALDAGLPWRSMDARAAALGSFSGGFFAAAEVWQPDSAMAAVPRS